MRRSIPQASSASTMGVWHTKECKIQGGVPLVPGTGTIQSKISIAYTLIGIKELLLRTHQEAT